MVKLHMLSEVTSHIGMLPGNKACTMNVALPMPTTNLEDEKQVFTALLQYRAIPPHYLYALIL